MTMLGGTLEKNEASENAPTEKEVSDSATTNVEEPKAGDQFENKVEILAEGAKIEKHEESNSKEGNMAALFQNTSEDDEETDIFEEEASEEEAIEDEDEEDENSEEDDEETNVDEDEVSEEDDEKRTEEGKENGEGDGGEAEKCNSEKVNLKVVEDSSRKLASVDEPKSSLKKKMKKRVDDENSENDDEETAVDEDQDEVREEKVVAEEDDQDHNEEEMEITKGDKGEAENCNSEKVEVNLEKVKKSSGRTQKKVLEDSSKKLVSVDELKSSLKRKVKKRVDDNSKIDDEETAINEDEEAVEEHTGEDKEIAKNDKEKAEKCSMEKVEVKLKNVKKSSGMREKKKMGEESSSKLVPVNDPKSPLNRKVKKRVKSMGMVFMCSSKTKNDCFQYGVLGLPESKKDMVEKIYPGMRLFLYDVDMKLMYGIFKAKGSGGYNIEPKAFKSKFPSQVRFIVLNDCLPLAEEKFKKVIKENYFTKNKFDCQLNSEQVKKLCELFVSSNNKQHQPKKLGRNNKAEKQPLHREIRRLEKQSIRRDIRKVEKQPIRRDIRKVEKQPVHREGTRKRRTDDRRWPDLREEIQYLERPRKRPRNVISPLAPRLHVPVFVSERSLDVDAYRRDSYLLESRDPYRGGRDPYPEHHDPYRDERDPNLVRRDSYRDGRDPYLDRRDPYTDRRDPYPEPPIRVDSYTDRREPYKEDRDSYVRRRDSYKDDTLSETYSTFRRDPVSDSRDVYRSDRGVAYRDSYRREDVLDRQPLSLETTRRYDVASQDPYVSYRALPSNAEPLYPAEYPSRSGLARVYHL